MKKYPIGKQDLRNIRTLGFHYVDKTEEIARVFGDGGYFFLSRPRRFGKSLTISTMAELYGGDRELFGGLWAYEHWDFEARRCPVIWLQFASSTFASEGVARAIERMLDEQARRLGVGLDESLPYEGRFRALVLAAAERSAGGRVVILVDEYDKPLVEYLFDDTEQLEINRKALRRFYGVLKDLERYIETFFVTGVSAFSKVSLFSDLNSLKNLTILPEAAKLVGLTAAELEREFAEDLDAVPASREEIRCWYNGYSWGGGVRVYNPWSILHLLDQRRLNNYWAMTGSPEFLVKGMVRGGDFAVPTEPVEEVVLTSVAVDRLSPVQLLFQTGYLTLARPGYTPYDHYLDFPNQEVRQTFNQLLLASYAADGDVVRAGSIVFRLGAALREGDVAAAVARIDEALAGVPSYHYERAAERFYHAITQTLFNGTGFVVQAEASSSRGRADLVVEAPGYVYCWEFKLDGSAGVALEQIREQGYLERYASDVREKVAVGLSFSSASRSVDAWVEERWP